MVVRRGVGRTGSGGSGGLRERAASSRGRARNSARTSPTPSRRGEGGGAMAMASVDGKGVIGAIGRRRIGEEPAPVRGIGRTRSFG